MRTLVILNPQSRGGAIGRRWPSIERRLREALGALEVEATRGPGDARRVAREGVRAGMERIVVAGGDGTLSEVASGLLSAELADYACLGLLPLGTGGDFGRSLGASRDLDVAIQCLAGAKVRRVDAGRARYRDRQGRETTSYFLNVASAGVSGLVVELVQRTSKAFGGSAAFLVATLRALARYRSAPVVIRVDGDPVFEGLLGLAAVANGRYFGGGMHIAPAARIDDALFDVVFVGGLSKAALLAKLPKLYAGSHVRDPDVQQCRGRRVEFDAPRGGLWLEFDGEPLGTPPAVLELLPGAISLLQPSDKDADADADASA